MLKVKSDAQTAQTDTAMKATVLEIPGVGLEGQCGNHTGTLLSNPPGDLRNLKHSGLGSLPRPSATFTKNRKLIPLLLQYLTRGH